MSTGSALRDSGVTDVLAADASITRDYARLVAEAVDVYAGTDQDVTAETIRAWIDATYPGAQPHSPNVISGAMQRLASSGRLVPVGWREASRPEARARVLRVWRAP